MCNSLKFARRIDRSISRYLATRLFPSRRKEHAMMAVPKLPGYEILTCLGGGMLTSVYAARAVDTDVPCAVKMLRPDWKDQPIAIKLLQREARACLAVEHPHLVRLVDQHVMKPP